MKLSIALLALFIFSDPSEAGCSCSSGGDAGFNFLGDPSFNIDMTSFDEFSRASYAASTMQEPASFEIGSVQSGSAKSDSIKSGSAKMASQKEGINNISIDLDDGSHIDLILYPAGEDLFGTGKLASGNVGSSEALGVVGIREGDRLIVEMVSSSGDLCRVDLSGDDSGFSGDFVKITPEGETTQGSASGAVKTAAKEVADEVLPKNVVVIGSEGK